MNSLHSRVFCSRAVCSLVFRVLFLRLPGKWSLLIGDLKLAVCKHYVCELVYQCVHLCACVGVVCASILATIYGAYFRRGISRFRCVPRQSLCAAAAAAVPVAAVVVAVVFWATRLAFSCHKCCWTFVMFPFYFYFNNSYSIYGMHTDTFIYIHLYVNGPHSTSLISP